MLAEATQSQQVRRDSDSKVNIFAAANKTATSKTDEAGAAKKMKTALILLEDIDLVFDDLDDGFYTAVNTLSQQSKRPIIMTTSSTTWMGLDVASAGEKCLK